MFNLNALMQPNHRLSPLKRADLRWDYAVPPDALRALALYGDDLTNRGEPDRSLLNRHEWYEMLYFVNKFANEHSASNANPMEVAWKAEHLIHTKLPSHLRSHQHVEDWLMAHWND